MGNRIALTQLATRLQPELKELTPGYRRLYMLGLDGKFPLRSEPGVKGYYVFEDDIPIIIEKIRAAVGRQSLAAA